MSAAERAAYAAQLSAFRPITLWVMLRDAVDHPGDVPAGWEWRVDVIRCVLVMAELRDPDLRFEFDPGCYGLEGGALRAAVRTSARGSVYYAEGIEKTVAFYQLLAERLRAEEKIAAAGAEGLLLTLRSQLLTQEAYLTRLSARFDQLTELPDLLTTARITRT